MAKYATWAAVAAGLGLVGLGLAAGCSDPESKIQSADAKTRIEGIKELAKRQTDQAVQKIAEGVNDRDETVACEVVRALATIQRPAARKVLRDVATTDKRAVVRQVAVSQYGAFQESLGTLRDTARLDEDPAVRREAVDGFVRQRSLADVPLLVEIAETEQDLAVQARAVNAIERLVGIQYGFDPKAPLAARKKALERIRSQAIRMAAAREAYEKDGTKSKDQ